VTQPPQKDDGFEVRCPHCHRTFRGERLGSGAERHIGFKCPHCKLFVAFERSGA